tara:strand:- start:3833 stop:4192 length:360 start_codon:yes stop_codon:yes gene_type:complete
MWEYINSFWETGKDATEYVYSATGEVYDSVTGEVVGYYDETTAAIYDSAGNLVEYVSDTAGGLYDDMRGGLTRVGDLASEGFDAVGRVGDAAKSASYLGFLALLIPTGAIAYWYFLGRR